MCLLSSLFLLFPSFIRIDFIQRHFRFFLYEKGVGKAKSDPARVEAAEPTSGLHTVEPNQLFAGILLCAALYGSGLIAESLSDVITSSEFSATDLARRLHFFSDPEIRIDAFNSVGQSALTSASVPPDFVEFMTDYSACREQKLLEDREFCPTCSTIYSRAKSFYYTAKNVVYRQDSYFKELSRLQNRIDFTRAASQIMVFLALELGLAYAIGAIAEGLWIYRQTHGDKVSPFFKRAYSRSPTLLLNLVKHWTIWMLSGASRWAASHSCSPSPRCIRGATTKMSSTSASSGTSSPTRRTTS